MFTTKFAMVRMFDKGIRNVMITRMIYNFVEKYKNICSNMRNFCKMLITKVQSERFIIIESKRVVCDDIRTLNICIWNNHNGVC